MYSNAFLFTVLDIRLFHAGPFSQRVMLTLAEKDVPFQKVFLDELHLPDWLVTFIFLYLMGHTSSASKLHVAAVQSVDRIITNSGTEDTGMWPVGFELGMNHMIL